jgi:hypothetical protein
MHGADKETEASKGDPPGIAHCRLTAELAVTRVVWVSAGKGVHALFSSLNWNRSSSGCHHNARL